MSKPILHGECFLAPIDTMPDGKVEKSHSLIVVHSETGHHHVLECDTDLEFIRDVETYIRVNSPAHIVHKKSFDIHQTLTVEPGTYQVKQKQEYNPWEKVMQRVFD